MLNKKTLGYAALLFSVSAVLVVAYWLVIKKSENIPITNQLSTSPEQESHYIGSNACAGCHQQEAESWQQSDHFHAMEKAEEKSVLGDFNRAELNYFGKKTLFIKKDNKFQVSTENQLGKMETFAVSYTLGHWPLQQYLVTFDDGRIQTLPFSWDARPKEKGGQRWFHIYPEEKITPENPLFWTRPLQNWNYMCADCHTTDFAKNFSNETNTFHSQWSELAVGCEGCHGAGSAHAELMKKLPDRKSNLFIKRLSTQTEQIDQCGSCHARRDRLVENPSSEKMMHTWRPELLRDGLYFNDGQIHDEVFVTGSFLQSKMYAAGVSCSNCHNPHTGQVKIEGNGLCAQCHMPEKYDTSKHHQHKEGSVGAQCVNCHMPQRTYMEVDPRRDHSFTIPRLDLSHDTGAPNACVNCHKERDFLKKQLQIKPESNKQTEHYGMAFWQARNEQAAASQSLQKVITESHFNAIVKATALMESGRYLDEASLEVAKNQLKNSDAIIRYGAVQALAGLPLPDRAVILLNRLHDDALSVRLAMAPLLVGIDTQQLTARQKQQLDILFKEYTDWLTANSDRADALLGLANFSIAQGNLLAAQKYFEKALERDATSLAAYLNYADYYRGLENDQEAEKLLRRALNIYPDSADVHFSLGLLLVRQKSLAVALAQLKQAAELAPDNSHYAYVYGVGLYSAGQQKAGIETLKQAQKRFPANQAIPAALQAYGI